MRTKSPLRQKLKKILQVNLMKKFQEAEAQEPSDQQQILQRTRASGVWVRQEDSRNVLSKKKINDMMELISFANSQKVSSKGKIINGDQKFQNKSLTQNAFYLKSPSEKLKQTISMPTMSPSNHTKFPSLGGISNLNFNPKQQSQTDFSPKPIGKSLGSKLINFSIGLQESEMPGSPILRLTHNKKRDGSVAFSAVSGVSESFYGGLGQAGREEKLKRNENERNKRLMAINSPKKKEEVEGSTEDTANKVAVEPLRIRLKKLPELKTDSLSEKTVGIIEKRQRKMYGEFHLNNLRIRDYYNNNKEKFAGNFLADILKDRGGGDGGGSTQNFFPSRLSYLQGSSGPSMTGNKFYQQRRASLMNLLRYQKKKEPQKLQEEQELNQFMDNCFALQLNPFSEDMTDEESKEHIHDQIKNTLESSIRLFERKLSENDINKELLHEFKNYSLKRAHTLMQPKARHNAGHHGGSPKNRRKSSLRNLFSGPQSPCKSPAHRNSLFGRRASEVDGDIKLVNQKISAEEEYKAQIESFKLNAQNLETSCIKAKKDNRKFKKKALKEKKELVKNFQDLGKEIKKYYKAEVVGPSLTIRDFRMLI